MNRILPFRTPAALIFSVFLVVVGLGCRSTDAPKSASFASVIISGNTPGQIAEAAIEVFKENGYQCSQMDIGNFRFEKEGTRLNNFAYGNWLGDTPVWVRVKASIVPVGDRIFRLQCAAFMVRDKGGSTEEELALSHMQRGHYQKLLDEVAKRFTPK